MICVQRHFLDWILLMIVVVSRHFFAFLFLFPVPGTVRTHRHLFWFTAVIHTSTTMTSSTATRQNNHDNHDDNHDNHDNHHKLDNHDCHVWLLEPPTSHGVLTLEGLDQIVHHKYKAGTYTALDLLLNDLWQWATDQLPLWLAPNAVTALGGCFALLSYVVTAHYAFDLWPMDGDDEQQANTRNKYTVPNPVLIFNGLCLLIYYTLDCMDGKQARRTQSSSPLGQLFDHGVDCLANLSHLSLMQAIVQWKAHHYMLLQCSMQLGFFQAQLEEYYTGSLPHAAGNFGTTEVLYGMGLWSILTGLLGCVGLLDRAAFFSQEVLEVSLSSSSSSWAPTWAILEQLPGIHWVLVGNDTTGSSASYTTSAAAGSSPPIKMQAKDLMIVIWVYGFLVLAVLSWIRLWIKISNDKTIQQDPVQLGASALSKWISPLILCVLACDAAAKQQATATSSSTSSSMLVGGIRYPSLAIGLGLCLLTIKLVVLGMARMAYAAIQWADVLPLVAVWALATAAGAVAQPEEGGSIVVSAVAAAVTHFLYPLATAGYLVRLVWWTKSAVDPLCRRMNICLFTIPYQQQQQQQQQHSSKADEQQQATTTSNKKQQ